jgi:hypothetical protein
MLKRAWLNMLVTQCCAKKSRMLKSTPRPSLTPRHALRQAYNRGKDGGGALSAFCAYLPLALRRLFPLKELNLSPSDIIDLDSSTAKKFSRHLICKINGGYTVFRDNGHMGAFVVRLVAMIEDDIRRGSCKELGLERLYANGSDGRSEIFIDMGVYTKNRCFRTAFSCKHGRRGADLCPSSSNESEYDSGEDEAFFYRSLVTRMPPGIDMVAAQTIAIPPIAPRPLIINLESRIVHLTCLASKASYP